MFSEPTENFAKILIKNEKKGEEGENMIQSTINNISDFEMIKGDTLEISEPLDIGPSSFEENKVDSGILQEDADGKKVFPAPQDSLSQHYQNVCDTLQVKELYEACNFIKQEVDNLKDNLVQTQIDISMYKKNIKALESKLNAKNI